MKKLSFLKKATCMLILISIPLSMIHASLWRVNNDPTIASDFKTLQGAIDTASAGDTLYVEGTQFDYGTDGIVVDKQLIFYGPGYFLEQNDTTQVNPLSANISGLWELNSNSEGSEIYGLNLKRIRVNVNNTRIERNFINGRVDLNDIENCIYKQNFHNDYINIKNSLNIAIKNNIIKRISGESNCSAIVYNNTVENEISVYNSDIKNNIIYRSCVGCGQGVDENSGNTIQYNLVCRDDKPAGATNQIVEQHSLFIFSDENLDWGQSNDNYTVDGKFRLASNSPAIEAGEGELNCGAFVDNNPYVLSGLPDIPHIYDVSIPASASDESGLPITIQVKTQK